MIEVFATVDIAAPADVVWEALTDLRRFPDWNPFIRRAWGSLRVGRWVWLRVRSGIGVPLFFRAKVTAHQGHREIRWRGHFLSRWIASGDHAFTLEPSLDDGVRFAQREVFSGLLPWLARSLLVRKTQQGFDAMNQALKARAEERRGA
jgi:hypothetical protein